jgi:hypothetical protein
MLRSCPAHPDQEEGARQATVSARSIDEWARKRMIPYLQIGPQFYLYDFEAVRSALRKHYQVDAAS